jgi:hypothetical protein
MSILTAALETTEAIVNTEPAVDIESIKEIMDGFDPATLLPELGQVFDTMASICRVAVLAGPIVLLVLGLAYLFLSPKEANYYFGYRCYYGMGSVQAWRFTQRLAGIVLGGLGLVLTGVMLVISGGFAGMDTMAMAWKALGCMLWEAGLTAAAVLAVNSIAALTFDFRGEYRNRKRRK